MSIKWLNLFDSKEKEQFYEIKNDFSTFNPYFKIKTVEKPENQIVENQNFKVMLNLESKNPQKKIFVSLEKNEESAAALNGRFILVRRRADTEYVWDTLSNLHIINDNKGGLIYTDFTAEQGVEYIYAIYRENSHYIRTHKLVAEPIVADFEDMFLYDGERQLKIRFNPQVSSFKTNILESKSETIGSKYPFFFRNGRVAYKEFPINGLISYFMDEKELFLTDSDMGLEPDLSERLRTAANDYTEKHLRTV